jgi:hypothetical protein
MTDMRKYAGSSFIKYGDVSEAPIQATIVKVAEGKYGKPDLLLESGEHFGLNATNVKTLIAAYGRNDQDWIGERIELYAGTTEYQDQEKKSVLVRPLSPGKPKAERAPLPANPDAMDDEIPF